MKAVQQERPRPVTDSVAAVARFVAGFAHQVKSPLTGVRGYGELMGREEDDGRRRYWGERLQGGLESLDRMIEGFRRYQVPEQVHPQRLHAATLVESAWRLAVEVTPGGAAKRVRCSARLPEDLYLQADPFHFRNLLVNLMQNALDANPVESCVSVLPGEGDELLRIEDEGAGLGNLSPDLIQRPFFTTRPDRAGLGLAVAGQIAAAHGLGLRWRPRHPHGTSVSIYKAASPARRSEP